MEKKLKSATPAVHAQVRLPLYYEVRPAVLPQGQVEPSEVIVLLHGFAETGERILNKLADALPQSAVVLAPSGPFPMPRKVEEGYLVTHAWYFYDPKLDFFYIDVQPARTLLVQMIEQLGYAHLPKRIIGFSQGGYLAPVVALSMAHVKQVVGIGCEYLVHEILAEMNESVASLPFRLDGIHGSNDDVISLESAQKSHRALIDSGVQGEFHVVLGGTHRIDETVLGALQVIFSI